MTHTPPLSRSVLTGLHHFHPPSALVVGFVVVIIVGAAGCRATRWIRHGLRIVVFGVVVAGIMWFWRESPGHLWIHAIPVATWIPGLFHPVARTFRKFWHSSHS